MCGVWLFAKIHSCYSMDKKYNYNKQHQTKRIATPLKVNNLTEIFAIEFEHSLSETLALHAMFEMKAFFKSSGATTPSILLVNLVKEVINNGYDKDLLSVIQTNSKKTSVDMIDKIVNQYQIRTQRLISKKYTIIECIGEYNQFSVGLVNEFSKVYKIFDEQRLRQKCFIQDIK